MIKTYKLKIYANKNKFYSIDELIFEWKKEVNYFVNVFWNYDSNKLKGSFPPKPYRKNGTRLKNDASLKAWQIVKGVKNHVWSLCEKLQDFNFNSKKTLKLKNKIEKIYNIPIFKENEKDFDSVSLKFILDLKNSFDFWIKISTLNKGKRISLPCKSYNKSNDLLQKGILKNSGKIQKIKKSYYLSIFIEFPEKNSQSNNYIGLDQGMTVPVATSTGRFYGDDLLSLRRRTKWRKYNNKISPYKQGLNRISKQLIKDYPDHNFVVENLDFKGKKNRSRSFRRRNNNWSYNFLSNKLEEHGKLEGFKVIRVNPYNTSLTCPLCGSVDKLNRNGINFRCVACRFTGQADTVGAINILRKSKQGTSVPLNFSEYICI